MNVSTLKTHANEISPMAWQRVVIKLLPEFKNEGFYFNTISDEKVLSKNLVHKISDTIYDLYKVRIQAIN